MQLGDIIQLTLFGESHGPGVGALVTRFPAGVEIDAARIEAALARRRPGGDFTTARVEPDPFEFLSGIYRGHTTGAPLTLWIPNRDARSDDYKDLPFRPGHADLTARAKYSGFEDPRGGGYFSGRLTAPLVAVGAIARDLLAERGIRIESAILTLGGERDEAKARKKLEEARRAGDSLGGEVRVIASGVPRGLGGPRFDALDGKLARAVMSIGAVKAVEIGSGRDAASKTGAENNDPIVLKDGAIRMEKNDAGGILGGITTGEDVILTASVKPTPTISREQKSADREGKPLRFRARGRHDTALVLRIPVVLESVVAFALLDALACRFGELNLIPK